MKEGIELNGKVGEEMISDFVEATDSERIASYPMILFSYSIGVVQAVTADLTEAQMGRTLAMFCKKVYLDKNGKINSIELERWVWYLLNTIIEKNQPGYLEGLKSLNIINEDDALHQTNIYEASFSYGEDGFNDALGENFAISYSWINLMVESIKIGLINDPLKAQEALPKLFQMIRNDVAFNAMLGAISVVK